MSNWFEDNPTKSVIMYTLVVAASVWATSTFILQDNRLALLKSEVESQRSLTEQYKSKVELLQRDLDFARTENAEYKAWLAQTKDAVPLMIPRLMELKASVAKLQSDAANSGNSNSAITPTTRELSVGLGRAFIDEGTGVIVTLKKTYPERTASLIVKLPDTPNNIEQTINPGAQWKFKANKTFYTLTVTEIQFIGDSVKFIIAPVKQ